MNESSPWECKEGEGEKYHLGGRKGNGEVSGGNGGEGDGLIEEGRDPEEAEAGDRRRRTYRLTRRGRTALGQQAKRLAALVDHARQKKALPVPRPAS